MTLRIFTVSKFFKKRFLTKPIPAGFKAPGRFVPDPTDVAPALDLLRKAIARQHEIAERAPHPALGDLSREDWDQFNLRHAEMHMSFIVEA